MQIFVNSNYDFVKWRKAAVILSTVFILIGAVLFFSWGMPMGIDFAGGANVVLKFQDAVPTDQLRSLLPDATIQQFGKASDNSALIRLPKQASEGDYAGQVVEKLRTQINPDSASKLDLNFYGKDRLAGLLRQADPDKRGTNAAAGQYYDDLAVKVIARRSELGLFTEMSQVTSVPGITAATSQLLSQQTMLGRFNLLSQETVGPQVGKELQQKALLAIILSALAMGAYIWIRFDIMFGVGAIICILHDCAVAMAFLVMMRMDFSLNVVAALLLIVGYSVNDTVVMYDRVRENKRKAKVRMSLAEHLNLAINQTLSRTILTAGSVFLVLLALLIFGGEVIRDFSWILTIGVLSGTYSTLLIVPAVSVAWERFFGEKETPLAASRAEAPRRDESRDRKRKAS